MHKEIAREEIFVAFDKESAAVTRAAGWTCKHILWIKLCAMPSSFD